MSEFFQEAYRRARSHYTQDQWLALTPAQITDSIYREMRAMDAARAAAAPEPAAKPRRRGKPGPAIEAVD